MNINYVDVMMDIDRLEEGKFMGYKFKLHTNV